MEPGGSGDKITMSVVSSTDEYLWKYKLIAKNKEDVFLSWDAQQLGKGEGKLLLISPTDNLIIDMKAMNMISLSAAESRDIYFAYSRSGDINELDLNIIGNPFPNPTSQIQYLPVYADSNDQTIDCALVDITGHEIAKMSYQLTKGYNEIQLDYSKLLSDGNALKGIMLLKVQYANGMSKSFRVLRSE